MANNKEWGEKILNGTNKVSMGIGALSDMADAFKSNSETKDITPELTKARNIGNTQFDGEDVDTLASSYNLSSYTLPSMTASDIRGISTGKQLLNTGKATLNGAMTGAKMGGLWGGIAGAIAGLGSGIGGMWKGNQDAHTKKTIYDAERNRAYSDYNANYLASVDNVLGDTMNRNLRSVLAEGGMKNTDYNQGYTEVNAGSTHETNPYGGVKSGIAPDGQPNLVEEGEVIFNDFVYSNRLSPSAKELKEAHLPTKYADKSFADIVKALNKDSEDRPNDPISNAGKNVNLERLARIQERQKAESDMMDEVAMQQAMQELQAEGYDPSQMGMSQMPIEQAVPQDVMQQMPEGIMAEGGHKYKNGSKKEEYLDEIDNTPVSEPELDALIAEYWRQHPEEQAAIYEREKEKNPIDYSFLRTSPVLGAAAGALDAALQRPDYTNVRRFEDEVYRPLDKITSVPVGRYTPYTPFDTFNMVNQLNNQKAAINRGITNLGGNAGTVQAGLLANNYNASQDMYNALNQAHQYNVQNRMNTLNFNNNIDRANEQSRLAADQANAQLSLQDKYRRIQGASQALNWRENIASSIGQARSNTMTNFWNQLGNLGRDSFNLKNANAVTDYRNSQTGDIDYRKLAQEIASQLSAYGGKLNRKKR